MRKLMAVGAMTILATSGMTLAKSTREEAPAATNVGTPVSCIPLNMIRESHVRNDRVIDFRTSGKKWYRNTLPHSCPSLGFEERFLYKTSINQLCSVDMITVLRSNGGGLDHGPSCGLGKFQPIELAKK